MNELTPVRYSKRVFYVDALRVTRDNMQEVADWCGGEIQHTLENPEKNMPANPFVKVNIVSMRPVPLRQTRAFAGDWVTRSTKGEFRVYAHQAFVLAFEEAEGTQYVTKI